MRIVVAVGVCALLLAACESAPRPVKARGAQFHPQIELLLPYDTNHDGTITRAELEAGLKADFAAADTDRDGRLDADETRAVNQARWAQSASTASPLVDWNDDGYVDFNEFAATARSLFAEIDKDGDGKLTPQELLPFRPAPKPEDGQDHP